MPCPYVSCTHHLWLMELDNGFLRVNRAADQFPGDVATWSAEEIEQSLRSMKHTCVLQTVELYPNGMTEQAIATLLGFSESHVSKIAAEAVAELQEAFHEQV